MRYAFIEAERQRYPVHRLCTVLGVSRSGYYAWRKRLPSPRSQANAMLGKAIQAIFARSRQTYGRYRVQAELGACGHPVGHNRIARIMQQMGLKARQRRRRVPRTTQANHALPVAANLLQQDFTARRPNQKWLADITYIATQEGWLYLAIVLDTFSRKVVGWSIQPRLTTPLVTAALHAALGHRQPVPGLVHHSDRGSQYASLAYRQLLAQHHITPSMSRTANCYDNAMMESFFSTLKLELPMNVFPSRDDARYYLFDFIEVWYNRQRRHSALDYLSPAMFEARHS